MAIMMMLTPTIMMLQVAIKIARKASLSPAESKRLVDEVAVMATLDHVHIVRLHAFYEDASAFYIVTELMTGEQEVEEALPVAGGVRMTVPPHSPHRSSTSSPPPPMSGRHLQAGSCLTASSRAPRTASGRRATSCGHWQRHWRTCTTRASSTGALLHLHHHHDPHRRLLSPCIGRCVCTAAHLQPHQHHVIGSLPA